MLIGSFICKIAEGVVISSDDFFPCCVAAHVFIADAEAKHVDSHVGRGFVWALAIDAFEKSIQYREDFDVTVVA